MRIVIESYHVFQHVTAMILNCIGFCIISPRGIWIRRPFVTVRSGYFEAWLWIVGGVLLLLTIRFYNFVVSEHSGFVFLKYDT